MTQAVSSASSSIRSGVNTAISSVKSAVARPAPKLPSQLAGGPANNSVYQGVKGGEDIYVGITNNVVRRTSEHGTRFDELTVMGSGLTRGEARAVEQAMIVSNNYDNIINSISPKHSYYDDAVAWGQNWLKQNGLP